MSVLIWVQIVCKDQQQMTLYECLTVFDPDQGRHSVSPDLDPNYLHRLSAEVKGNC